MTENLVIRPITEEDRAAVISVEGKSMPHWRYVERVFDQFMSHPTGEFSIAELDGQPVGIAKFTTMPEGSAWVETLRVDPAFQGRGIGKSLYKRFFDIANEQGVDTLRMYTGMQNKVSRGLAEHFGFTLEASFYGANFQFDGSHPNKSHGFKPVTDQTTAADLLMPLSDEWNGFMVMNRTFYRLTSELCGYLVDHGRVFADGAGNVVAFGARFMPDVSQHIGLFGGDAEACLSFAKAEGQARGAQSLACLFPIAATETRAVLQNAGFEETPAGFIVMKGMV